MLIQCKIGFPKLRCRQRSIYDPTNEIVLEKHYYPFGLEQTGAWFATVTPDNQYRYNGKELDEATGLYDYGARYYDPAVARWGQVDPLAEEFAPWSPYHYTYCNPIRFIDPDGRSADDIIIRARKGDNRNYSQRTLVELQSLTNDELGFADDGETVVITKQGSGSKNEGTQLIRDLIGSENTSTLITNETKGKSLNGEPITEKSLESNSFALAKTPKNAGNGVGTGTNILYSPDVQAKFTAEDGSRQTSKPNTVLAHELIHSDNNRTGTREVGKPPLNPSYKSNREEEKTTQRENIIRDEQRQKRRNDGSH